MPRNLVFGAVRLLLDARREGRAAELLAAAREEAEALPRWQCVGCGERNPGTFETCWNCGGPRPADAPHISREAEVALALESAMSLETARGGGPDDRR